MANDADRAIEALALLFNSKNVPRGIGPHRRYRLVVKNGTPIFVRDELDVLMEQIIEEAVRSEY